MLECKELLYAQALEREVQKTAVCLALFPSGVLRMMLRMDGEQGSVFNGMPLLDFGQSVAPGMWMVATIDAKKLLLGRRFQLLDGGRMIRIHGADANDVWELPLPEDRRLPGIGSLATLMQESEWIRGAPFEGYDMEVFKSRHEVILYDPSDRCVMLRFGKSQFGSYEELFKKLEFSMPLSAIEKKVKTVNVKGSYCRKEDKMAKDKGLLKGTQDEMNLGGDTPTGNAPAIPPGITPLTATPPPAGPTGDEPGPLGEAGEKGGMTGAEGDSDAGDQGSGTEEVTKKRTKRAPDDIDAIIDSGDIDGLKLLIVDFKNAEHEARSKKERCAAGIASIATRLNKQLESQGKEIDKLVEKKIKEQMPAIRAEIHAKLCEDAKARLRAAADSFGG